MTRDQDEFAAKIKAYLDAGATDLRAGTVYKLQQARAKALAGIGEREPVAETRLVQALAGAGGGGGGLRRGLWLGFGILLIAVSVFGYQQWQLYQQTRELAELDLQILTSDLPIDAYVDRGFQTWLTSYQR